VAGGEEVAPVVIASASEAIQDFVLTALDCFVAALLAMTG
jgi:hypothetical protein